MNSQMSEWINRLRSWLFAIQVTFADKSRIEWFNREAILYVEPGVGTMEISWMFRPERIRGRTLRLTDIDRWDAPNEAQPVTTQKRDEIVDKIREYCRRRRISLAVVA